VTPVSVIVPARDAEDTLAETLESLRAQRLADWEALVFLDADDRLDPCHLAHMRRRLERGPGLGAVHCGWPA
jgi:cellulose synthase/poly-beta-1,6-N-acetylglucosamine synthase-like glycosyltransferase